MKNYSRDVIINGIVERDNEIVRWLYLRVYQYLESYISARDGTPVDALDIFHEGMLILFEKITDPSFPVRRNIPEYLFGICRYLWYRQYRQSKYFQGMPAGEMDLLMLRLRNDFPVFPEQHELRYILYLRHLPALDMKCRRLLEMSLQERDAGTIRDELSYRNRNSVYRKKFGCLRKLASRIQEDPDYKYLF